MEKICNELTVYKYVILIAPAEGVSGDTLLQATFSKQTPGDAGFNLPCLRGLLEHHLVDDYVTSHKIPLGVRVCVRKRQKNGTFADWPWFLTLCSSTAANTNLRLANAVGIMDGGYRGEVVAIVDNISDSGIALHPGRAYFQMVLPNGTPMEESYGVKIVLVKHLSE